MTHLNMPLPGYPMPPNEEERLAEILLYESADGPAQESLDQIARMAQSLFNVPVSLVTLVGRDEQIFIAKCGVDMHGTPRKDALCNWTIMGDDVVVAVDTMLDERFVKNAMVTGETNVRFYAGAPLTVRPGIRIGSLCLIDTKPRAFSETDALQLEMLAKMVVNELRRRRMMIDLQQQEEQLSYLAYTDTLTGLPNRAAFQQRLVQALERAERDDSSCGLLMVGLDHFKGINDTLGHNAGDRLLCVAAQKLRNSCPQNSIAARLGGDEFALLVTHAKNNADLAVLAERVLEHLRSAPDDKHKNPAFTASIGMALFPADAQAPADLVKNAGIALQRAKLSGRNRAVEFTADMCSEIKKRFDLLAEARAGIEAGEFELFYQPIVNLAAPRMVTGFESLMRWRHPRKGVLGPFAFLAALEDEEVSFRLGEVALNSAMKQMRVWIDKGVEFGRIAVNLSASQFRAGDLVKNVIGKLAHWKVPPDRLTLEVTENIYMGWGAETIPAIIKALHDKGILIALDDFGTGYASLAHLNQFPIDRLKIDKSFVQSRDMAVVKAVLMLAIGMNMKTVAEGVEDDRQLAQLEILGCDQVQGYYFAKPMPAGEVPAFLRNFSGEQAKKTG